MAGMAISNTRPPTRRPAETTTNPGSPPAVLIFPRCDSPLTYQQSVLSGVPTRERWDAFQCGFCLGHFEYRVRTRKLKPAP